MDENALLLAKAIESLRSESIWYKEYLFPIVTSFFSAVLGAFVAYTTIYFQEKSKTEKEKIKICNDWTFTIAGIFSSLVALKSNYSENISNNPLERALLIGSIINQSSPINKNIAELSFIAFTEDDPSSLDVKWRNLSLIGALISNYNLILQIWEKRNNFERPLKEKIINAYGNKNLSDLTLQNVIDTLGHTDLLNLIDLTEKVIDLTDDLIIESNNFLSHFPNVTKSILNTKKYGRIITHDTSKNNLLQELIKKCPELDYKLLTDIYGLSSKELKKRYSNGY